MGRILWRKEAFLAIDYLPRQNLLIAQGAVLFEKLES